MLKRQKLLSEAERKTFYKEVFSRSIPSNNKVVAEYGVRGDRENTKEAFQKIQNTLDALKGPDVTKKEFLVGI